MENLNYKKPKIIVYSVNTGGYDELRSPDVYDPNIRYILFTDNKYFKSDVWVCKPSLPNSSIGWRNDAAYRVHLIWVDVT